PAGKGSAPSAPSAPEPPDRVDSQAPAAPAPVQLHGSVAAPAPAAASAARTPEAKAAAVWATLVPDSAPVPVNGKGHQVFSAWSKAAADLFGPGNADLGK